MLLRRVCVTTTLPRCMCTSVEAASKQKEAYIKQMAAQQESAERPADWELAKPYSQLPGPKPVPIVGNLWRFLPVIGPYYGLDQITQHSKYFKTKLNLSNLTFLLINRQYLGFSSVEFLLITTFRQLRAAFVSFVQEFGNIVKLSGLQIRDDIVLLFDPDAIELCYRNEGVWPHREGLQSLIYYKLNVREDIFQGQGGVLTSHGEKWYNTRTVVNPPMMQPRSAQLYIGTMNDVADDFMERMRLLERSHPQGEMPEDFSNELNKWALESICTIGLNKRLGLLHPNFSPDGESQQFITNVLQIFDLLEELDVKPSVWRYISTPAWRKYVKTLDKIMDFQLKHINEAMEKLENSPEERSQADMSILEQLLKRDKKIALAMVFDMLVAGIDTTSRTSAAALYYLSTNPRAQEKLREECRNVLPNKDSPITKEVLNNMPYLKAVIKETTRLAPIAIGNVRRTPKDMVVLGYQIPKGVDILMSHMYLSRQDKYFPRAMEFIPERWLRHGGEEYQSKDSHPFVFMPFGFGPRSCIGKRLAQLEMEVLLAKIIRNFSITWPHDEMKWVMTLLYGVGSPLKFHAKSVEN